MYKIDDHIICAMSGMASDANYLLDEARYAGYRVNLKFIENTHKNISTLIKNPSPLNY